MSYIVEQAGGMSTTGYERIMEMTPESLHQCVPVILGSKNEVGVSQTISHSKKWRPWSPFFALCLLRCVAAGRTFVGFNAAVE
jgi:hypothetical protein